MLKFKKEPMKLGHYNFIVKNRKAQIGESISWVVATLIIIFVLLIFVYFSVILSKTKSLKLETKETSEDSSSNWIDTKTEIAYQINSANKNKIENWISQENEEQNK